MDSNLKLCIAIIKYATKNRKSIQQACQHFKKGNKYFSDFLRRGFVRGVENGSISQEEYDAFMQLREEYKNEMSNTSSKASKNLNFKISDDTILKNLDLESGDILNISLTKEEQEQIEYDAYKDDKYDERSLGESIKDADGKIIEYHYKILIRDQEPLEGVFTREEMDKIYRLYSNLDGAGLTLRAVSREFHNLNFRDFKRILRAFNITKSSIPVAPHILLERDPSDVAEIILRNKENILLKKLDNERSKLIEKHFMNTQKKLLEYQKTDEWIGNVIDRYLNEYSNNNNNNNNFVKNYNFKIENSKNKKDKSNPTIAIFGDIHYGKRFDNPILGRAYNKEIAHERVMQIAKNAIEDYNLRNSKEIILICVGDLVESIMEDGMHAGHVYEMDLFQEEQIFFALDSLKAMLIYVLENSNCPIQFHAVQGNHDRIGIGRDQDKNRTAGKIICKFLEREFKKQSDKITFNIPKNNLLRIITGNLMLFTQHGDSSLSKKKPSDIVNLQGEPGCYSVLIQGHWHSLKSEEGNNYLAIKIPSVASTDKFILEELGNNNLAGFIICHQPEDCYGLNYTKITLK